MKDYAKELMSLLEGNGVPTKTLTSYETLPDNKESSTTAYTINSVDKKLLNEVLNLLLKEKVEEVEPKPKAYGWRPWSGGIRPVDLYTTVRVVRRDMTGISSRPAKYHSWEWNNEDSDIIAYEVTK